MASIDRTKITPQTFPAKPSPTRLNSGGRPLESGLYALMKLRKSGKPNGRTAFGKAFIKRQEDYVEQYGGDPSPAEMNLITDTTWTDFYVLAMDMELVNKKLTRRGKAHPLLDIRVKLAAHRRENLKLLGLKRVQKAVDWRDALRGTEDTEQPEAPMPETQAIPVTNDDGSKDSNG